MALKVTTNQTHHPDRAAATEMAYKTLVASSRQKTFERVLNQVQNTVQEGSNAEINSLQAEMSKIQSLQQPQGNNIGTSQTSQGTQRGVAGGFNALATSALLKLSALSGGANRLEKVGMKSLAAEASKGASTFAGPGGRESRSLSTVDLPAGIGSLAARFESGDSGVDAIGYDRNGGTSYGLYQISSRAGTMRSFIEFLGDRAPDLARRLTAAGPSNTGGRSGAMPAEWKRIAAEDPVRFAQLQHDFITESHFMPAVQGIYDETGVDITKHSRALKEVLWSTAVQHGPRGATRIFSKVINRAKGDRMATQAKDVINGVYSSRARQFGQSTPEVQGAVQGRFREERAMALAMLAEDRSSRRMGA